MGDCAAAFPLASTFGVTSFAQRKAHEKGAFMNILIAYATTEGQTDKISRFIGGKLADGGHQVVYHNVIDLSWRLSVADFDRAIVAGSVHSGKHQEALDLFVFANHAQLNNMPTLFVAVSLAVVFPDSRKDAEKYVDVFKESTGWKPNECLLVAGAMRHGAYSWFEESKLLEGDLADHAHEELKEDQEFTDWTALHNSVVEFVQR